MLLGPSRITAEWERIEKLRKNVTPLHDAAAGAADGASCVPEQTHNHGPWCEGDDANRRERMQHLADPEGGYAAIPDQVKTFTDASCEVPSVRPRNFPNPHSGSAPNAHNFTRGPLLEGHSAASPGNC